MNTNNTGLKETKKNNKATKKDNDNNTTQRFNKIKKQNKTKQNGTSKKGKRTSRLTAEDRESSIVYPVFITKQNLHHKNS